MLQLIGELLAFRSVVLPLPEEARAEAAKKLLLPLRSTDEGVCGAVLKVFSLLAGKDGAAYMICHEDERTMGPTSVLVILFAL